MEHEVLTVVLSVVVAGVAAQWFAWRAGLPAIVVLLVVGFLVGPVMDVFDPSEDFGREGFRLLIGLVVAIIVFEGGLNLNLRELQSAGSGILRLTVMALPLSWLLGSLAGHFVGGLPWPAALLFGAILVVTGPTVILPLLRQTRLQPRPSAFLKWEGIVNDPLGALLTILVLEYLLLTAGPSDDAAVAAELGQRLALGTAIAVALGVGLPFLIRWAFRRDYAPEPLKTPILLASVLGIYTVSNAFQEEAGLIAATVFGVVLANLGINGIHELKRFKESLTMLLVSGLFILLTADLEAQTFERLSWPIAVLTLCILFVVRPVAILLATIGSGMSLRERLLVAWIAPRGIVAAAVAGIAEARLSGTRYENAELILPTVFAVIATTVIAHGFTLRPLARRLGLLAGNQPGLMIVGASDWSTSLARLLTWHKVPVLVADTSWEALEPARRAGIASFCGELLSEQAEQIMDLGPVDYVLAATGDDAYNALICSRFAPDLGRERVHQVALRSGILDAVNVPSREWRGKIVGHRRLDYEAMRERHAGDWDFTARRVRRHEAGTRLAEGKRGEVPLLLIRQDGTLSFFSPERTVELSAGDTLISFARVLRPEHAGA